MAINIFIKQNSGRGVAFKNFISWTFEKQIYFGVTHKMFSLR